MAHAKNRETVLETLEAELETDRTKTYVVELSPLGLVEMTRQNTTDGARGILTRVLPDLLGKARVLPKRRWRSMSSAASALWRASRRPRPGSSRSTAASPSASAAIGSSAWRSRPAGASSSRAPAACRSIRSACSPREPSEHVQAQRVPVREGQEVEVELEFSLSYSPRDAVGYVDGYMVVVEGGRQFLGQSVQGAHHGDGAHGRPGNSAQAGAELTVLRRLAYHTQPLSCGEYK